MARKGSSMSLLTLALEVHAVHLEELDGRLAQQAGFRAYDWSVGVCCWHSRDKIATWGADKSRCPECKISGAACIPLLLNAISLKLLLCLAVATKQALLLLHLASEHWVSHALPLRGILESQRGLISKGTAVSCPILCTEVL